MPTRHMRTQGSRLLCHRIRKVGQFINLISSLKIDRYLKPMKPLMNINHCLKIVWNLNKIFIYFIPSDPSAGWCCWHGSKRKDSEHNQPGGADIPKWFSITVTVAKFIFIDVFQASIAILISLSCPLVSVQGLHCPTGKIELFPVLGSTIPSLSTAVLFGK